jgi:hypothetical protein
VALFTERARAVHPRSVADPDGDAAEAVRTLCRRVDGIPLAIELAASWVRVLTPAHILVALDDRFRLLVGGARGTLPRQQTLAASVEWSYDLLREDARVLLRRLAVFAGGFTLDQVGAVCAGDPIGTAEVLGALTALVDASMVQVDEAGGTARYRLLETIREYAETRLAEAGEVAATRDRHLDHFLGAAEAAAAELDQGDQDVLLARLEAEHDNLRAGLRWGLAAPDAERGRRLAAALTRLWFFHGHVREGIPTLQRAIERAPEERSRLQGELYTGLALLGMPSGRLELVEDAAQRAIDIGTAVDDDQVLALAHAAASYVPFYGDFDRGEELAQAARRYDTAPGGLATDVSLLLEAGTASPRSWSTASTRWPASRWPASGRSTPPACSAPRPPPGRRSATRGPPPSRPTTAPPRRPPAAPWAPPPSTRRGPPAPPSSCPRPSATPPGRAARAGAGSTPGIGHPVDLLHRPRPHGGGTKERKQAEQGGAHDHPRHRGP